MTGQPAELRCDVNPSRMFVRITETNLIEVVCRDCSRRAAAGRVLHRFDISGALVETVTETAVKQRGA